MDPVAVIIINSRKEYWQSRGSNQGPPVLKSATLQTELWGSAQESEGCWEMVLQIAGEEDVMTSYLRLVLFAKLHLPMLSGTSFQEMLQPN